MSNSSALRSWIRRRLLGWFAQYARKLPWRTTTDPYCIWISEVMLQQTQVATVIPYYVKFLESYPTLAALDESQEQDVLRLWEGLGYYRRARDLCRAAHMLAAKGQRTIPDDPQLLRTLPGFGRYTVGAVLSQAYDRRLPILEANSRRVLCRLFGIDKDPRQPAVDRLLWQRAEELLPRKAVGDFNQALMELGALVCTPAQPNCDGCPLHRHCQARLQSRQEIIPLRAKAANITRIEEVAVVVRRRDRILLVQRPPEGRWATMWEVPHDKLRAGEAHADAARRLLASLGLAGEVGGDILTVRHSVTRFRITMICVEVAHRGGTLPGAAWVRPDELGGYPLSTPQRRVAKALQA